MGVGGHGRADADPGFEIGHDVGRQRFAGGHFEILVLIAEGAQEEAAVGLAGLDGGAGIAAFAQAGGGIEEEGCLDFGRGGGVADEAAGGQDGPDFGFKETNAFRIGLRAGGGDGQEGRRDGELAERAHVRLDFIAFGGSASGGAGVAGAAPCLQFRFVLRASTFQILPHGCPWPFLCARPSLCSSIGDILPRKRGRNFNNRKARNL